MPQGLHFPGFIKEMVGISPTYRIAESKMADIDPGKTIAISDMADRRLSHPRWWPNYPILRLSLPRRDMCKGVPLATQRSIIQRTADCAQSHIEDSSRTTQHSPG